MADQIATQYRNENHHLTAGGYFYTQTGMLFWHGNIELDVHLTLVSSDMGVFALCSQLEPHRGMDGIGAKK